MNNERVFVVAVSGGVDSMVLLHKIVSAQNSKLKTQNYVIAHFDHGIRLDSHKDAEFVRESAKNLQIEYELGEGKLGADASEAEAREARYAFLRRVAKKHRAEKIITAHHQDDVLETMIINILRGTGPRGLAPMSQHSDILRPLLSMTKADILAYASDNKLQWREDPTNQDLKYMRNYVRLKLMPKLDTHRQQLLDIHAKTAALYQDIDMRVRSLTPTNNVLHRSRFVQFSYAVQREVMRAWLLRSGAQELDRQTIERLTVAAKTLPIGAKTDIDEHHWLQSQAENLLIITK